MTATRPTCFRILLPVLCLALLTSVAGGMFMRAPEIPVERLLKNIAAYVKEKPDAPQGYYLAGRVNALAYVLKSGKLRAFERKNRPLPYLDPYQGKPKGGDAPSGDKLRTHVKDAIANYRKAIAIKADSGLYHLGLAYILKEGASEAVRIGPPPGAPAGPKPTAQQVKKWEALIADLDADSVRKRDAAQKALTAALPASAATLAAHADDASAERAARIGTILASAWREQAIAEYLKAFQLASPADSKVRTKPLRGLKSLVSYEAGLTYTSLVQQRGATEAEKKHLAAIQKHVEALRNKPRGPITPIVFSLEARGRLDDLLAPRTRVRFDLDGDGRAQTWPWVKPQTALLVWAPRGADTQITSGRQLFGSVTFWLLPGDGFTAMTLLDDDRDGRLTGGELHGLAGWFDRNSNGRSDPGEVVPIERLGVYALETRPSGSAAGVPWHRSGLILLDGSTRPVYDWTPSPAKGSE